MTRIVTLFLVCGLMFTATVFSQSAFSTQWKMTKTDTIEVSAKSGNIIAEKETFSELMVWGYNGTPNGPATADSAQKVSLTVTTWPFEKGVGYVSTRYIQFKVSPVNLAGNVMTVSTLKLSLAGHGASTMNFEIYCSNDGFATSTKLNASSLAPGKDVWVTLTYSPAMTVQPGQSFSVRVHPWYNSGSGGQTGKSVCPQDVQISGTTALAPTAVSDVRKIAATFRLDQNYPNPFNPTTVISYQLPVDSRVQLRVYNALGNEVASLVNREQTKGAYNVNFNAANLPSGIYYYKLEAGSFTQMKKMMLLK